jgi:hypothetical protein
MEGGQFVPARRGQRIRGVLSWSGTFCVLLLVMAAVAGAKVPKPSVTAFTVTPSSVATQNGWVTLSATVANASSCEFSAKPAVSGLPVAVPCSTGAVTEGVDLPPNAGKKTARYSFHLSVAGAGGTRSAPAAKATVGVGAGGIPDMLTAGSTLQPGAFLLSPDHQFELVMQTDGNLVLYNAAKEALWSSQTSGEGNYLVMQGEGNLVVYNASKVAQWNASTWGFPGAYLQLQDDGNLVLYQDGHAIWTYGSGYKGDFMNPGEDLQPGAYLLSPDHEYELVMQTDGNLVLYNAAKEALWSSQTSGEGNYLVMQGEGNLVVYNASKVAQWNASTWGFPGAYLQLQDDGNLVLYQDGHAIWTYGSGYKGDFMNPGEDLQPGAYLLSPDHEYELVMQTDGNLVLYNAAKEALWSSQTSGEGNYLVMQGEGNLVVYNDSKVAQWNAGTGGNPGAYLKVQNDDNVVIYQGGTALWDWESGPLGGGGGGGGGGGLGQAAIAWAQKHLGTAFDVEECLVFVQEAYLAAGVNIGHAETAADYWNVDPEGARRARTPAGPCASRGRDELQCARLLGSVVDRAGEPLSG